MLVFEQTFPFFCIGLKYAHSPKKGERLWKKNGNKAARQKGQWHLTEWLNGTELDGFWNSSTIPPWTSIFTIHLFHLFFFTHMEINRLKGTEKSSPKKIDHTRKCWLNTKIPQTGSTFPVQHELSVWGNNSLQVSANNGWDGLTNRLNVPIRISNSQRTECRTWHERGRSGNGQLFGSEPNKEWKSKMFGENGCFIFLVNSVCLETETPKQYCYQKFSHNQRTDVRWLSLSPIRALPLSPSHFQSFSVSRSKALNRVN